MRLVAGNEVPLFRDRDGSVRIGLADSIRDGETRIDHAGFDLRCRMNDVLRMTVTVFVDVPEVSLDPSQVKFVTTIGRKRYRLVEEPEEK